MIKQNQPETVRAPKPGEEISGGFQKNYVILDDTNIPDIMDQVNELLIKGYQLAGHLIIVDVEGRNFYYQPMIKRSMAALMRGVN